MSKDLFGKAILDYQNNNFSEDIKTWTNISEEDTLPISYLFRDFNAMPKLEQTALKLCKGNILDVGCGAGSHALWLQKRSFNVTAIDISEGAVETCKLRGLKSVYKRSILEEKNSYDTILLLMNGTGIFKTIEHLNTYLTHLKSILNSDGKIIIDSSDIIYMYDEDYIFDDYQYYGELDYYLSYKNEVETPLKWLYLDYGTLSRAANYAGLNCNLILEGEHYDYLAELTLS